MMNLDDMMGSDTKTNSNNTNKNSNNTNGNNNNSNKNSNNSNKNNANKESKCDPSVMVQLYGSIMHAYVFRELNDEKIDEINDMLAERYPLETEEDQGESPRESASARIERLMDELNEDSSNDEGENNNNPDEDVLMQGGGSLSDFRRSLQRKAMFMSIALADAVNPEKNTKYNSTNGNKKIMSQRESNYRVKLNLKNAAKKQERQNRENQRAIMSTARTQYSEELKEHNAVKGKYEQIGNLITQFKYHIDELEKIFNEITGGKSQFKNTSANENLNSLLTVLNIVLDSKKKVLDKKSRIANEKRKTFHNTLGIHNNATQPSPSINSRNPSLSTPLTPLLKQHSPSTPPP